MSGQQSEFVKITIEMVVPRQHLRDKLEKASSFTNLSEIGSYNKVSHHSLTAEEWDRFREVADASASVFDNGEWVEIYSNPFADSMRPNFAVGTIGKIIDIKWGWSTQYVVEIECPAMDADGDIEYLGNISFCYTSNSLRRLLISEIPEKHRVSAKQRQSKLTEEQADEILAKIKRLRGLLQE